MSPRHMQASTVKVARTERTVKPVSSFHRLVLRVQLELEKLNLKLHLVAVNVLIFPRCMQASMVRAARTVKPVSSPHRLVLRGAKRVQLEREKMKFNLQLVAVHVHIESAMCRRARHGRPAVNTSCAANVCIHSMFTVLASIDEHSRSPHSWSTYCTHATSTQDNYYVLHSAQYLFSQLTVLRIRSSPARPPEKISCPPSHIRNADSPVCYLAETPPMHRINRPLG